MTIFITGSSGKTAGHLAKLLAPTHPILVASRTPSPTNTHPTAKFDWLDESTWELPFQHEQAQKSAIVSVYLVTPDFQSARDNVVPFVRMAVERGVKCFVLLSAFATQEGGSWLGKAHAELKRMGVEWTVLRPHYFMGGGGKFEESNAQLKFEVCLENLAEAHFLPLIRSEGNIYTGSGNGKIPFISARDIAAVAHRALIDEKAHNTDYIITGPESLTYDEIAIIFSQVLGRKIEHVKMTKNDYKQKMIGYGCPEELAEDLAELEKEISEGLGWETTQNVKLVTEKDPLTMRQFVEEMKDVWN